MRATEFISEGGWASTLTQNTKITPQLVATVMEMCRPFVSKLNAFLKTKGLGPTEISSPGGSATHYQRDLEYNPTREYGDVDVQFHIPDNPNIKASENEAIYKNAIKEFCDLSDEYSTQNGTNVIFKVGDDYVQVDLIMSTMANKQWINALKPEYNVKGVLCNSLYSSLGLALNISLGGGYGAQAKIKDGQRVPFNIKAGVVVQTITNDPLNWAVDIAKYLGCKKISPRLKAYKGMIGNPRVADIVNSILGIAESMELNGLGNAAELIEKVKSIYNDKIDAAINSSKFDKAETPTAVEKAEKTKALLAKEKERILGLF